MKKGKIIVIEGTDCSGKETQANMLLDALNSNGYKTIKMQFPMYDTPTGKIVGGPYLGKNYIGNSYFEEGASHVDPKVAAMYYVADRKYNIHKVLEAVNSGVNVILDRYVDSNMAHKAGKIEDDVEQNELISWLEKLEYGFMELPRPDTTIFLYMPYEATLVLKSGRVGEAPDGHENDPHHLMLAERAYKKLAKRFFYDTIECTENGRIKTIDEIASEVYKVIINKYYFGGDENE